MPRSKGKMGAVKALVKQLSRGELEDRYIALLQKHLEQSEHYERVERENALLRNGTASGRH